MQLFMSIPPDMIVEGCIVVELKSVEELARVHSKQLLTYIRLLDYRLGLLINLRTVMRWHWPIREQAVVFLSASLRLCVRKVPHANSRDRASS